MRPYSTNTFLFMRNFVFRYTFAFYVAMAKYMKQSHFALIEA